MRSFIYLIISLFSLSVLAQDGFESLIKAERDAFEQRTNFKYKKAAEDIDVLHHGMYLSIDPAVRFIEGKITTVFKVVPQSLNIIRFDLDDRMTVDSVVYSGSNVGFSQSDDQVSIPIPSLTKGEVDSVTVYYHGDPSKNEQKGFSYDYHMTGPISWTLSEPYGAYGWWPCKQQLGDKIDSFDMWITVPKGNKAAGLGLLQSVDTLADSSLTFHWTHDYPLATYLVAVAVTNYEEFTHYAHFADGDSLAVLEYMYPEFMFIADTQALKVEPMLTLFDTLCGPYPFRSEKYGHAQWGRGGGMEHQTMSFMSDLDYTLMAHELAHQWYGDKITCGSWQDIWLNEGFATYFTAIAYEFLRPRAEWKQYMETNLSRATSEPDGSVYVYDTSSVSRIFSGRLSYSKAAMVLHMLRWTLGDEIFFNGIKQYTEEVQLCYDFAKTDDLKRVMEEVSGVDLDEFFEKWVYSQGFPQLRILWQRNSPTTVKLGISQTPSHSSVTFFPLDVQLRLIGANGEDSLVRIAHRSLIDEVDLDIGFKVTNVEYDPNMWLLAKTTLIEGDHSDLASVAIFPNPSAKSFQVFIKDKRIDRVEVYNTVGQLMLSSNTFGRKNEAVNVSHQLSTGYYLVKAYVGNEAVIAKIIIQ